LKIILPLLLIILFFIRFLKESKKAEKAINNEMWSCESCGTFVPKNLAIKRRNKYFCSEQCIK